MMNVEFARLALTELRIAAVDQQYLRTSNKRILEAMTINEELRNLGYTLTPDGIRILSKSSNPKDLLDLIRSADGDVKAKPMYPNFPNQVMNMDEATFRLHQLIHYFSTYGIEWLTGEDVDKGWCPNVEDTEKTVKDETLLNAKVIELVSPEPFCTFGSVCYARIVTKHERMTDKERQLIRYALPEVDGITMIGTPVPFKQNLLDICNSIVDSTMTSNEKKKLLGAVCQHSGDVWKILDYVLTRHDFHLKTSQKRMFVKLLESYSIADFRSNLILSNKKGERVKLMLSYLDYGVYSRSADHKKAVGDLYAGRLRSWEAEVKALIEKHDPFGPAYAASHPGTALRWITYMLRNGYTVDDILRAFNDREHYLSTQTLVTIINKFTERMLAESECSIINDLTLLVGEEGEAGKVISICKSLLQRKFKAIFWKYNGKKVYIDGTGFDLASSVILTNDKSAEGGYVRSGIAYRIPENVERMRFFCYWNDPKRVDIDLHAYTLADVYGSSVIRHIGWNADFKMDGVVTSGDLTFSDSAEYIDMAFDSGDSNVRVKKVLTEISLFNQYEIGTFKDIETCFVGMQAVKELGEDVKLYNPENCFFKHFLTTKCTKMFYGIVDLEKRTVTFLGDLDMCGSHAESLLKRDTNEGLSIKEYLEMFLSEQSAKIVRDREQADVVIVMEKPVEKNEISLIDNNFFMDL